MLEVAAASACWDMPLSTAGCAVTALGGALPKWDEYKAIWSKGSGFTDEPDLESDVDITDDLESNLDEAAINWWWEDADGELPDRLSLLMSLFLSENDMND